MEINLSKIKNAYVIGIKGSGVIAVVEILHSMGVKINGSDTKEKFFTDEILKKLDIDYYEEFNPQNVPDDADLIIYSTAYNESNNPEIKKAREKNITMLSYPEILAHLFNKKYGIAICGTHGKTTTSALLASVFQAAGLNPQAVIGSQVIGWEGNALSGKGEYFIAETDEYQDKLDLYQSKAAILTSCDFDHPDYFKNFEDYKNTFKKFVGKISNAGFLVVWGDSVDTNQVAEAAHCNVLKYGFADDNDYQAINMKNNYADDSSDIKFQEFEIMYRGENLGRFKIKLFGKHNILNSTAVVAVCHKLNLKMDRISEALFDFRGTVRRFEYVGKKKGAILIDDYGHHPEEIKATLKAVREIYPDKKIWAIFHPHTYTRTKALLSEFSQSFDDADKTIILDVYGSAREVQGGVHSKELVDLINKYDFDKADYIPTIDETATFLKGEIGSGDVVITIGAGNVWEVAEKLKEN